MSERSTTSATDKPCQCSPWTTGKCDRGTSCCYVHRAEWNRTSDAPDKTSGEGSDPMRLAGACSPSTTTTPAREPGEAGTYFRCPTCGVGRIGTNTACAECKRYYLGKVSAPGDRPDFTGQTARNAHHAAVVLDVEPDEDGEQASVTTPDGTIAMNTDAARYLIEWLEERCTDSAKDTTSK